MPTEPSSASEDAILLRKQIATARIVLLIVAVATLVSAGLLLPNLSGRNVLINIVLTAAISTIYFLLALWTRKKPYTAILAGLLLLAVTVLLDVFWNPFGPFSRWQSKTLTLLLLLLGLADSRDAQRKMKNAPPPPVPGA